MRAGTTVYFDHLATSIGTLILAANDIGLQQVSFYDSSDTEQKQRLDNWVCDPAKLAAAKKQLSEYFEGQRREFDLRLAPAGTPFQRRVWKALRQIPYGETITYGELAGQVGSPRGYRAVGNANGRNPLVIVQPCHRVVASGNKLGGFSAGLSRKKYLLKLEQGVGAIW